MAKPRNFWEQLVRWVTVFCDPYATDEETPDFLEAEGKPLVLEEGEIEDSFDVGDTLGEGTFGVVRRGVRQEDGLVVALKFVDRTQLAQVDDDLVVEEARVLSRVQHESVVRMYAYYQSPERHCLVMELMKGGELFDAVVKRDHYTERTAREVVRQLLDACSFIHRRGIIHRDLKPENLLLVEEGGEDDNIKLADFGFAKQLAPPIYKAVEPMGSPGYVAPEVLRRWPYDDKADVFSCGVIAYVLLAGFRPFEGATTRQVLTRTLAGAAEFPVEAWGPVSEDAKELIASMLDTDASRRPSAPEALQHRWMTACLADDLECRCLKQTALDSLKRRHKNQRFRAAVDTVMAANRLGHLLKLHKIGETASTRHVDNGGDTAAAAT